MMQMFDDQNVLPAPPLRGSTTAPSAVGGGFGISPPPTAPYRRYVTGRRCPPPQGGRGQEAERL
jgi:hypothetical protein